MISLDNDVSRIMELPGDSRIIPPDSNMNKNHESLIMKHIGPVLLIYLPNPGLSARIMDASESDGMQEYLHS